MEFALPGYDAQISFIADQEINYGADIAILIAMIEAGEI
jgi:hypothetical protein